MSTADENLFTLLEEEHLELFSLFDDAEMA